jgi:putative transposase
MGRSGFGEHFKAPLVYFFTVNLADRSGPLLVEHVDALRARHPFASVAWCVLPDHLHAVWVLPRGDADFATRWMLIKAEFSRRIAHGERVSLSRCKHGERGIWQRRYWEHAIRDERDLRNHVDYIHYNPVKHGHVVRVRDWPHSSFHRCVRDGVVPIDWAEASRTAVGLYAHRNED